VKSEDIQKIAEKFLKSDAGKEEISEAGSELFLKRYVRLITLIDDENRYNHGSIINLMFFKFQLFLHKQDPW
jgi:hypothetical protein